MLLALLVALFSAGLTTLGVQPAHASDPETVQVGMPFGGKWARSVSGSPNDCSNSGAHPSCHPLYQSGANWSTDVYALDTDVAANFSHPTGTLSLRIEFVGNVANCSAGKVVRVRVKVDNVDLGWVQYVHLDTALANGYAGDISNGYVLGKTKHWAYDANCWQVSTDAGVHTHTWR
jgi:hypothetical protein